MSSFLNTINSTGSVLNLNNDTNRIVSIGNGLNVSGEGKFNNSLKVKQNISSKGFIYNSTVSGSIEINTDLRTVNKKLQPSRNAIREKFSNLNPVSALSAHSMAWSEELKIFVICSGSISPLLSPNGLTWTSPNSFTTSLSSPVICWAPELSLFVVGNGDLTNQPFQTNSNPQSNAWAIKPSTPLSTTYTISSIVWSPELLIFVATTTTTVILTSSDGNTWNENTVSFSPHNTQSNLVWSSELNIFLVSSMADSFIYYSYNGITWIASSNAFNGQSNIEWSPQLSYFVAVSFNQYATSIDGITWIDRGTNATNPFLLKWVSEIEMFIGSDFSSNVLYSYDGINWQILSSIGVTISSLTWSKELSTLILSGSLTSGNVYPFGPFLPSVNSSILANPSHLSINRVTGNVIFGSTTVSTSSITGSVRLAGGLGINETADAVSSTNGGSITTAGGVAIAKQLFIGGNTSITSTTVSTSTTSGALIVAGGLGVSEIINSSGLLITNDTVPSITVRTSANGAGSVYLGNSAHGISRIGNNVTMYTTAAVCTIRTNGVDRLVQGDASTDIIPTTVSTSTTTGALIVRGGLGVVGTIYSNGIDTTNNASIGNWSYIGANVNGVDISGIKPGFGFGWNQSAEQGENIMTYYTGAGTVPRFDLCTWNGTTRTVRMSMDSLGNSTFSANLTLSGAINGEGRAFRISNTSNGVDAYTVARITNDINSLVIFMNSSARTADGGVNTATIRNDAGSLRLQSSAGGSSGITLNTDGNVGVKTTTTNGELQFTNSVINRKLVLFEVNNNDHDYYGFGINNSTLRYQVGGGASHIFYVATSSTTSLELLRIASTGAVTIPGSLSKGSGTFDIQHPIIPEKRLVHSFVEGPRCDNIYRGTKKLTNGKAYINLDKECTNNIENSMSEGTFVELCSNPVKYLHNNSSFSRVIGSIAGNILTITCEDNNSNDTVDWMVIAERKDTFIKNWDRTNEDGELITEYVSPE